MPAKSPESLLRYYDERLRVHGDTPEGAAWPNEEDRQTRFAVMESLCAGSGPISSLCDLACGTGEFLSYLKSRKREPEDYLGVDLSAGAVDIAQQKHADEQFVVADILEGSEPLDGRSFDYVVANGLFTVKADVSAEDMWDFLTAAVTRMNSMAVKGFAFNVMSAVVDWQREDLFHVEMDRLADFLFSLVGRNVIFRSDYGLYEYTAFAFRDDLRDR